MTYAAFLDKLRQTPREWTLVNLDGQACIRRGTNRGQPTYACPICAVAGTSGWIYWRDDARKLGLRTHSAESIVQAADDRPSHDRAIRADLLAACGLSALPARPAAGGEP